MSQENYPAIPSVTAEQLKQLKNPELWQKYYQFMRHGFALLHTIYEANHLQGYLLQTSQIEEGSTTIISTSSTSPTNVDNPATTGSEFVGAQGMNSILKITKVVTSNQETHNNTTKDNKDAEPNDAQTQTQKPLPEGKENQDEDEEPSNPVVSVKRSFKNWDGSLIEHLRQTGFPFEEIIYRMASSKENGLIASGEGGDRGEEQQDVAVYGFGQNLTDIPSFRSFVKLYWTEVITDPGCKPLYDFILDYIRASDPLLSRLPFLLDMPLSLDAQTLAEQSRSFSPSELDIFQKYLQFEEFLFRPFVRYKTKHLITNLILVSEEEGQQRQRQEQEQEQKQEQESGNYKQNENEWLKLISSSRAQLKVAIEKLRGHSWRGIELEEGYEVRYPTPSDIIFYSQDPIKSLLLQGDHNAPAFLSPLLEVEVLLAKNLPKLDFFRADHEAKNVLLALRLFRPETNVGSEPIARFIDEYPELFMEIPRFSNEAHSGTPLYLSSHEAVEFVQFWRELRTGLLPFRFKKPDALHDHEKEDAKAKAEAGAKTGATEEGQQRQQKKQQQPPSNKGSDRSQTLRVAIERFEASYEEWSPANQILDLVIGLESIFSEGPDSIKYKYSLRAAVATGTSAQDRLALFEELQTAYNVRSALAHGSSGGGQSKKIREILEDRNKGLSFAVRIRTILARSIIRKAKWLHDHPNTSDTEFISELDMSLLKTEDYPFWFLV
jgi:hypothetical protein